MIKCIGNCGRETDALPITTPSGAPWKAEWGWLCPTCANESKRRTIAGGETEWRESMAEQTHRSNESTYSE